MNLTCVTDSETLFVLLASRQAGINCNFQSTHQKKFSVSIVMSNQRVSCLRHLLSKKPRRAVFCRCAFCCQNRTPHLLGVTVIHHSPRFLARSSNRNGRKSLKCSLALTSILRTCNVLLLSLILRNVRETRFTPQRFHLTECRHLHFAKETHFEPQKRL